MQRAFFVLLSVALFGWGLQQLAISNAQSKQPDAKSPQPEKIESTSLPNAYWIHEKVISGGQPHGEAAFEQLEQLGVKTVISVDGAKPEIELAKKHGLRYVHLPHGYDGIPEDRALELAKAVRDLPGPVYIHCHHGKHRSPTASAVACVKAGLLDPAAAVDVLTTAGTSDRYRGLYQSARSAQKVDSALLDSSDAKFPETAEIPPMAEAMIAIEHAHDQLKKMAEVRWQRLADHPDLEPAHEALLLREQYTELLRTDDVRQQPKEFQELLKFGEAHAQALEDLLRQQPSETRTAAADKAIAAVTQNCAECHQRFRDVPLEEKGTK